MAPKLQRLLPVLILGGVPGVAIGYSVYKLSSGGGVEFSHWVRYFDDVYYWAIGGAIVAGALSFIWPKNSK
jgi:hypothetical protein